VWGRFSSRSQATQAPVHPRFAIRFSSFAALRHADSLILNE